MRELALECGYTASSIRERIYAGDGRDDGEAAFTLPALATDLEGAVGRGCAVDVLFETTEDSAGA